MLTPGMSDLGNTKNALRQEGGDWKAGSVYIFVISTEGYTLFHGGSPFGLRAASSRTSTAKT